MTEKTLLDEFAMRAPITYEHAERAAKMLHGLDKAEVRQVLPVLAELRYHYAKAMEAERAKHVKDGPTPGNPLIPIEQQKPASKLIRVTDMKDGERAVIRKWGGSTDLIDTHVFRSGCYLRDKKSGERWWTPWRNDGNPHEAYVRDAMLVELLSEKGAV